MPHTLNVVFPAVLPRVNSESAVSGDYAAVSVGGQIQLGVGMDAQPPDPEYVELSEQQTATLHMRLFRPTRARAEDSGAAVCSIVAEAAPHLQKSLHERAKGVGIGHSEWKEILQRPLSEIECLLQSAEIRETPGSSSAAP